MDHMQQDLFAEEFAVEFDLNQMEAETEAMLAMHFLDRNNSVFARTKGGFVSLDTNGQHYDRVQVFCTFPFTGKYQYVSIREPDEKAKEIGMIHDLEKDVSKETAQLLIEQMNLRYFTPVITKIKNVKEEYGFAYFDVETDHGPCRFAIHMSGNAVVHLTQTRLLITDLDENRFEIPDTEKLTHKELKKIGLFL